MAYQPAPLPSTPRKLRSDLALSRAADALGRVLVLGCTTSTALQRSSNPLHPLHSDQSEQAITTYRDLLTMLVAERWWIEFLVGSKRKDDIRTDDYVPGWRLDKGDIFDELVRRQVPVNKLLLHPTWRLVEQEPRQWTLNRIGRCADGLELFVRALDEARHSTAERFRMYLRQARTALTMYQP